MEAIGRLAGGVAHDFNNLLTVINGYTELALRSLQIGDPLQTELQQIRNAGDRAANLTRQLLAFSRRQPVEPTVLNLNTVVQDAEKILKRVIGEDIEFACVLDPALGAVRADSGQIHQVLMNLVVNARDAMPTGGKLVLETSNTVLDERYATGNWIVEPGSYVVLSMSDTGVGMSKAVLDRLFEPFFTTKEQGKGTGLGLATVFGIVKNAGGHISVYSEPGQGTIFRIFLPRVAEEVAEPVGVLLEPDSRGHETVLVVEDQWEVRQLTCTILRSRGYRVLEAEDGIQALRLCESHSGPLDLIITDVVMPKMGGLELVERLTSLRPTVRILYVSGYTEKAAMPRRSQGAPIDYLQKPYTAAGLAGKVREMLDKR